jgi:hypothetical protein
MTTRAEHLAWCKQRALEYADAGDVASTLASMRQDMELHPQTAGSYAHMLGMQLAMAGHLAAETSRAEQAERQRDYWLRMYEEVAVERDEAVRAAAETEERADDAEAERDALAGQVRRVRALLDAQSVDDRSMPGSLMRDLDHASHLGRTVTLGQVRAALDGAGEDD